MAVDSAGDVFVIGLFQGKLALDAAKVLDAGKGTDAFLAKLDGKKGDHIWSFNFGGDGVAQGLGVATDSSGDVYLAATFNQSVTVHGNKITSTGGQDVLIGSADGFKGTYRWAQRYGGKNNEYVRGLAVNSKGSLFIGGHFSTKTNLGGKDLFDTGGNDIFVASYESGTGKHRWSSRYGGKNSDRVTGLIADAQRVYVASVFVGETEIWGKTYPSNGGSDLLLFALTDAGGWSWGSIYGGTGNDEFNALTLGGGGLLAAGWYTTYFPFISGKPLPKPAGKSNGFIANFSKGAGKHHWSQALPSGGPAGEVSGTAMASNGKSWAVWGQFDKLINLQLKGGTTWSVTSAGTDCFVMGHSP